MMREEEDQARCGRLAIELVNRFQGACSWSLDLRLEDVARLTSLVRCELQSERAQARDAAYLRGCEVGAEEASKQAQAEFQRLQEALALEKDERLAELEERRSLRAELETAKSQLKLYVSTNGELADDIRQLREQLRAAEEGRDACSDGLKQAWQHSGRLERQHEALRDAAVYALEHLPGGNPAALRIKSALRALAEGRDATR